MNTKPLQLDVNEQIECAHTLASKFYTDPAILDIEKTRIFLRTWQLAGTLSHVCGDVDGVKCTIADPESFFTAEVAGEPVIVVRDKQGRLAGLQQCVSTPCRAHCIRQRLQKRVALPISWLDLHTRWPFNWHARCRGR